MKIAVVGKGGSGKTVLIALLARAAAERGHMVLAVDLDLNPGLAIALDVPPGTVLPDSAVEEQAGTPYGWGLARHLSPAEAVRRYSVRVCEKIYFLGVGNIGDPDVPLHRYFTAVRQVADGFDQPGWVVLADLAAGPTNAFEGYARSASRVLVTVECTPTSVLTARRLLEILDHDDVPAELVLTKARPGDELAVFDASMAPSVSVPFDDDLQRLSHDGPLTGLPDDSGALEAVRKLATNIGL